MSENENSPKEEKQPVVATDIPEIPPFIIHETPDDIMVSEGSTDELADFLESLLDKPQNVINGLMEHYKSLNQINPRGKEFYSVSDKTIERLKKLGASEIIVLPVEKIIF